MITWALPDSEPFQVPEAPPVPVQYVELALDRVTWKLARPIHFIKGPDAVIQRIGVRFRFFLGEWFLDTRLGVPYYRDVLIKNPDRRVITTIFRQVLITTPGVRTVDSFTAELDRVKRVLTTNYEASLEDGTTVIASAEPFIIGS